MNKYIIKSLSTIKLLLYSILAFFITITLTLLTYNYIGKTTYPAITFIISCIISILLIRKNYWRIFIIIIDDLKIIINNKESNINDIKKYSFNDTNSFYGCKIFFNNRKLELNVLKKECEDYLKFKKEITRKIRLINSNKENKIQKNNWYLTKSAKSYGYFMIIVMVAWLGVMFCFPEKFKWSNFGLFLLVISGLIPILLRIFSKGR